MAKHKTSSKEAHRLRVEARRLRRATVERQRHERDEREAALRAALARPRLAAEPDGRSQRARQHPPLVQQLVDAALARAPRLVCDDSVRAFRVMAQLAWIRPLAEWQPVG